MDKRFEKQLKRWRKEIDLLDKLFLELVSKRLVLAKKILNLKKTAGLPITDKKREQEICKNVSQEARKNHLSQVFTVALIKRIIQEGKKR
ncbi:MAG TPA: chorismate mutase [Candidatus Nanoarchaeia archaeon]|nr:chorismate mutase [Candidatus Nanoarchaeia archaeon]